MDTLRVIRRRLLPGLLLALTVSLLPIHPALADATSQPELVAALVAGGPASARVEFRAAQDAACAGVAWIDTAGVVRGRQPITGWAVDTVGTGLAAGVDAIEIYRGSVRVALGTIGVPRPDVDALWERIDLRAGFAIEIDWSQEPPGEQTYAVWARTDCDWVEAQVILDVDPTPPVPAVVVPTPPPFVAPPTPPPFVAPPPTPLPPPVALSISDHRRAVDVSSDSLGIAQCVSRDAIGNCLVYEPGVVPNCVSRDVIGSCLVTEPVGLSCVSFDVFLGCTAYRTGFGGPVDVDVDFNVTLSGASSQTVLVYYTTADGSAIQGTDYAATSGTLSFAPGETSKIITVRVYGRDYGGEQTFYVRLGSPFNASLADGEGIGTIVRGGSNPGNCPTGASWNGFQCVATGGSGTSTDTSATAGGSGYSVTVNSTGSITLTWSPVPAATGYQIWVGTSACSNFFAYGAIQPSTTTAQTVLLTGTYCLQVRAQSGAPAFITSATGATSAMVVTGGSVAISSAACPAGDRCTFTVTQIGGSGPVNVTYSTQNGTAFGGASCPLTPSVAPDYVVSTGTVTVGANSTASIIIQTCANVAGESIEAFVVNLTGASAGSIALSQGVGTINP